MASPSASPPGAAGTILPAPTHNPLKGAGPGGSAKPNNLLISTASTPDPDGVVVVPRRRVSHGGGRPGGYKTARADKPELRGRPRTVELTRAECYWIQQRIVKLGDSADPLERRLLEKVRVLP